jgi:hypothetical protein
MCNKEPSEISYVIETIKVQLHENEKFYSLIYVHPTKSNGESTKYQKIPK